MRKVLVNAVIILLGVLMLTGCPAEDGPKEHSTKTPPQGKTTVESREVLYNQPGGEGKRHILIKICWHGASKGCNSFKPSKVERCHLASDWPDCKAPF